MLFRQIISIVIVLLSHVLNQYCSSTYLISKRGNEFCTKDTYENGLQRSSYIVQNKNKESCSSTLLKLIVLGGLLLPTPTPLTSNCIVCVCVCVCVDFNVVNYSKTRQKIKKKKGKGQRKRKEKKKNHKINGEYAYTMEGFTIIFPTKLYQFPSYYLYDLYQDLSLCLQGKIPCQRMWVE